VNIMCRIVKRALIVKESYCCVVRIFVLPTLLGVNVNVAVR
jgi:hypothetical protein